MPAPPRPTNPIASCALLGGSSIQVRFPPPKDKTCSCLAIAKFKDGKFLGYAELPFPSVERFLVDAEHPNEDDGPSPGADAEYRRAKEPQTAQEMHK